MCLCRTVGWSAAASRIRPELCKQTFRALGLRLLVNTYVLHIECIAFNMRAPIGVLT